MAWTTKVKWIYPPNWDGNAPPLGDNGFKEVEVLLSGIATTTEEEDAVKKIDISGLRTSNNKVPIRTSVKVLGYDINGLNYVKLEWDRAPRELIAVLPIMGAIVDQGEWIVDPNPGDVNCENNTGDILLTTNGGSINDTYSINLRIKLKSRAPVKASTSPA